MMIFLLYRTHTGNGQTLKYTKYIKLNIQLLITNLKSFIVETGQNSNGYYRKYSDGFIEQWGVITSKIKENSEVVIELPTSFNNINYYVTTSVRGASSGPSHYANYSSVNTIHNFNTYIYGIGTLRYASFYACGY